MISYARQNSEEQPDLSPAPAGEHIAPAPRVSVQAFCETAETAAAVQSAGEDRRLDKAHLKIQMGGMAAAIEAYRSAPTPNVIILETEDRSDVLAGLDQLATVCDAGTRVIVIGRINDVALYRELVRRGVSDYMIAPVTAIDVVRSVCNLFSAPEAKAVGRIVAVVGAKGGVGASTVAHNVAPPASTTTRIRLKASRKRCSRPTGSIPPSSIVSCRNAPTISACWRRPQRLTGSMISAPMHSMRSSTRFAPRCPASCSMFPINGRAGPSAH
jgi:pilus assembly protein CpaE